MCPPGSVNGIVSVCTFYTPVSMCMYDRMSRSCVYVRVLYIKLGLYFYVSQCVCIQLWMYEEGSVCLVG